VAIIVTMHQMPAAQPTLNLRPLGAPLGARSGQMANAATLHQAASPRAPIEMVSRKA
jgi:hypothetical protein